MIKITILNEMITIEVDDLQKAKKVFTIEDDKKSEVIVPVSTEAPVETNSKFKKKECLNCHSDFMPKSGAQKFCSDDCKKKALRIPNQ